MPFDSESDTMTISTIRLTWRACTRDRLMRNMYQHLLMVRRLVGLLAAGVSTWLNDWTMKRVSSRSKQQSIHSVLQRQDPIPFLSLPWTVFGEQVVVGSDLSSPKPRRKLHTQRAPSFQISSFSFYRVNEDYLLTCFERLSVRGCNTVLREATGNQNANVWGSFSGGRCFAWMQIFSWFEYQVSKSPSCNLLWSCTT